jgi:hypothetical protein
MREFILGERGMKIEDVTIILLIAFGLGFWAYDIVSRFSKRRIVNIDWAVGEGDKTVVLRGYKKRNGTIVIEKETFL